MQILVLRHEPFEHLGHFEEVLKGRNISFIYKDLEEFKQVDISPDPLKYDGMIIMGGPQSANDPLPELAGELKLIDQALTEGKPVLGICLGSQLIAKALGARVYKNAHKEIGWAPVFFTPAAEGDPVFGGLASPTTFCHWHGETFDLPEGAEWLAYTEKCRNQAFRWGRNVYGIQFHPEITPEMIIDWSAQPANCGDMGTLDRPVDAHAFSTQPLAQKVLEGWLENF